MGEYEPENLGDGGGNFRNNWDGDVIVVALGSSCCSCYQTEQIVQLELNEPAIAHQLPKVGVEFQKFYQGFGDRGDVVQENINCVGVGFGEGIRRGGEGVKHGLAHRGVRGGEVVEGGRRGGVRNARANELEGLEN